MASSHTWGEQEDRKNNCPNSPLCADTAIPIGNGPGCNSPLCLPGRIYLMVLSSDVWMT